MPEKPCIKSKIVYCNQFWQRYRKTLYTMTGQFKILISSLYNKKQFTNSNVKEFKILINKYKKVLFFFISKTCSKIHHHRQLKLNNNLIVKIIEVLVLRNNSLQRDWHRLAMHNKNLCLEGILWTFTFTWPCFHTFPRATPN